MKGRGRDGRVDCLGSKLAYRARGAGQGEQPTGTWQRDLVASTGGDHTGHEQLERRIKTFRSKCKERRRRKRADCFPNAHHSQVDIEWVLLSSAALPGGDSAHAAIPPA